MLPAPLARSPLLAGSSPARERLADAIARIASTPRTTALIHGPRGAGKREVARLIHAASARSSGPFVVLRAADSLAPAFARTAFEEAGPAHAARGGTLVLTAIEAFAPAAQEALVRELEDRTIDARVIALTSCDLADEVAAGRLREDLFYRVNVLALRVAPLAERRADLLAIAQELLATLAPEVEARASGLAADAALALTSAPWTGGLAELRGVLQAALARTEGPTLTLRDLALPAPNGGPEGARRAAAGADAFDGERNLRRVEERLIALVLRESGGNKSRAARRLGLNRQTLYNKLEALERASAR